MGKTKRGEITATCTYPAYCIKWIGEKHFLVGGGGGSSKTGVPNKFVSCTRGPYFSARNRSGIIAHEGLPNAKPLIVDFILLLPETNFRLKTNTDPE